MEDKTLILLTSKLLLPLMRNETHSQAHDFADSPLCTWCPFDLLYRPYGAVNLYGGVRVSRINSASFFMLAANTMVRTIISSAAFAHFPGETSKVWKTSHSSCYPRPCIDSFISIAALSCFTCSTKLNHLSDCISLTKEPIANWQI